jgi:hypothetical protein
LSPKAAKNWHRNSGKKRRVVINDVNMALLGSRAVSQRGGPRQFARLL